MAQEFQRVSVRQILLWITIQTLEPWVPISGLHAAQQVNYFGDGDVGVILHGLPEMLGRIVSRAEELNAFLNRVPVGENSSLNHRGGAPTVNRMLPFFLHGQEILGIAGGHGFLHLHKSLLEFSGCVRDQQFNHGNNTALDSATQ